MFLDKCNLISRKPGFIANIKSYWFDLGCVQTKITSNKMKSLSDV